MSTDGIQIRTFAAGFPGGHIIPEHLHGWHQLIYGTQGVITVHTSQGSWVVPPQRAVWVPAGVMHKVEMSGAVSMRTLYITVEAAGDLSTPCCVVGVSPLLRELILHAIDIGALDKHIPAHARLIGVILDQIIAQPAIPLQLPMPRDSRALKVAETLRADPGDTGSLDQFCRTAGASKRTIERLVPPGDANDVWSVAAATAPVARVASAGKRRAGDNGGHGIRLREPERLHLGIQNGLWHNAQPLLPEEGPASSLSAAPLSGIPQDSSWGGSASTYRT